jgi:integrase
MTKKEYLEYLKLNKLSDETAKTYYNRVKFYIRNKSALKSKGKNYVNQTKNAVKYYYKANDIYYNDEMKELNKIHDKSVKKRPKKVITKVNVVNKKINALKNQRMKIAFRFMQVSGLRIGEIAELRKNDLTLQDGKIFVLVRHGKGDKERRVSTIKDSWLYNQLQELEERNNRLFYKSSTLRKKAWQLNFKSHKLRKVPAKYINLKYSAKTEKERRTILQKFLGHGNDRTLKIYTDEDDREIDVRNTRFDI